MKFLKNAKYDYESNGISEENGCTKWYGYEKVKKPIRFIGFALIAAIFALSRVFKAELAAYGKGNMIIAAVGALFTLLIAVVPLHEILHLLVMPFKLYGYLHGFLHFKAYRKNDTVFGIYKKSLQPAKV